MTPVKAGQTDALPEAIINPRRGRHSPRAAPYAMLVSNGDDLAAVALEAGLRADDYSRLYMGRLYADPDDPKPFTAAGPYIGAPYAAMLMETLVAWGARHVIAFGWCGSLSPDLVVGDILLSEGAYVDEGTSVHYGHAGSCPVRASIPMTRKIGNLMDANGLHYRKGLVWTTDAIYRETPDKLRYYQERQALAVEMELSALFTLGRFRGVDVGAILIVSDELHTLKWHPGFGSPRFRTQRDDVCRVLGSASRKFNAPAPKV